MGLIRSRCIDLSFVVVHRVVFVMQIRYFHKFITHNNFEPQSLDETGSHSDIKSNEPRILLGTYLVTCSVVPFQLRLRAKEINVTCLLDQKTVSSAESTKLNGPLHL